MAIKEEFQGKTVWDGVVEVFDLKDHRDAGRVYAWAYDTDAASNKRQRVTVLHIHPIKSARDALKAAIPRENGVTLKLPKVEAQARAVRVRQVDGFLP